MATSGGIVVCVSINFRNEINLVTVDEIRRGKRTGREKSIRVKGKNYHSIRPGDTVWWKLGTVYWTPQENVERRNQLQRHADWDILLDKVS